MSAYPANRLSGRASFGVLVAATMVTLAFVGLVSATGQKQATSDSTASVSSPLPIGITFCIEAASLGLSEAEESILEQKARTSIAIGLDSAADHIYWEPARLAGKPFPVGIGCPSPPLPTLGGEWLDGIVSGRIDPVEERSYYNIFVFVMPLNEIDRLLGGVTRREAPQEITCSGDACFEVTSALYLTAEEVTAGGAFVEDQLLRAIGLRSD